MVAVDSCRNESPVSFPPNTTSTTSIEALRRRRVTGGEQRGQYRPQVSPSSQVPTFQSWASEQNPVILPTCVKSIELESSCRTRIHRSCNQSISALLAGRTGSVDTNPGSGIKVLLLSKKCAVPAPANRSLCLMLCKMSGKNKRLIQWSSYCWSMALPVKRYQHSVPSRRRNLASTFGVPNRRRGRALENKRIRLQQHVHSVLLKNDGL